MRPPTGQGYAPRTGQKVSLRSSPKQYMKTVVDQFNLAKWVGQEEAREKLVQAG